MEKELDLIYYHAKTPRGMGCETPGLWRSEERGEGCEERAGETPIYYACFEHDRHQRW